jgi:hypothetical protein
MIQFEKRVIFLLILRRKTFNVIKNVIEILIKFMNGKFFNTINYRKSEAVVIQCFAKFFPLIIPIK